MRAFLLLAAFAVLAARARGAEPRARDLGIPFDFGDLFVAFSTANRRAGAAQGTVALEMLPNGRMGALFEATVGATEEAIINALVAGRTMTGHKGYTVPGLPHDRLVELLRRHNRLPPASGR